MQPLFAVHTNVSLLSVNIAPSTFLAVFVVALVFLSLYIPRLPSLSGLFSFGRRRTANSDKDIVLQGGRRFVRNPQNQAFFEVDDGYYNHGSSLNGSPYKENRNDNGIFSNRQWQNNDGVSVDWRHRQLPPLPPPPFRPLLTERDEPEDDYDDPSYFRKKKSSRGDRDKSKREKEREKEREREREREKERAKLRQRQDKQSTRTSPFKRKHSSSATTSSATAVTSAELVVHRGRREHVDVYDSSGHLSDVSDREGHHTDWNIGTVVNQARDGTNGGAYDADGTSWASFGVLGRFTSRFRPGQQPAIDAHLQHLRHQQPQQHQELQELRGLRGPREHPQPSKPQDMQSRQKQMFGYPSTHSGFLETDNEETESLQDSVSVGGYSPPAWRRLENGDLSSGFWRKSDNILGSPDVPGNQFHQHPYQTQYQRLPIPATAFTDRFHKQLHGHNHKHQTADRLFASRPSSPEFDTDDDDVVDAVLGFDDDDVFDNPSIAGVGSGFLHGDNIGFKSRQNVAQYADDIILQRAMRTRLPGSMSPEKERSPEPDLLFPSPMTRMEGMRYRAMQHIQEERMVDGVATHDDQHRPSGQTDNYIRFAVRTEARSRTRLIESAIGFMRGRLMFITRTWMHVMVSVLVGVLSLSAMRGLAHSAAGMHPVPDLVKVAGVARSFEPLIYYSENGVVQVYDLEATGVAVWDLGESVRLSNMTSAPIIVKQLDDLSDTLRTLAEELTKFFANIDGDVDAILYVMEWARRELSQLQQTSASSSSSSASSSILSVTTSPFTLVTRPLTIAYDNVYSLLAYAGVLENRDTGLPTTAGALATTLFGMSGPQRTRAVLHRTFHDILQVLEEAVSTELQHSLALFALFQAVDQQFLNIVRTVAREASVQDEQRADLLAGLWTRILGPSAAATVKYERNRELLRDVREKTVRNKGVLVEHNHRLLALKTNLENLRRRLVTPLMRSTASRDNTGSAGSAGGTTIGLSLADQIRGLEDVNEHLVRVRTEQKSRLMDTLYGIGTLRERMVSGGGSGEARMGIDNAS